MMNSLCQQFTNDLKINKFFLSIFYNIFILNKENLLKLDKIHIKLIHQFLKTQVDENKIPENEALDLKEINDWKYILFRYFIKSKEKCHQNNNFLGFYMENFNIEKMENDNILKYIYSQDQLIIFEFIRDFFELKKENFEIEINDENLEFISHIFMNNLTNLFSILIYLNEDNFQQYLTYEMNSNYNISINFKLFLCLVDIFSILFPIKEIREFLQKRLNLEKVLDVIYELLKMSDSFYDNIFKRKKIKENFEGVSESNIFYCFQTNIFKFLSNYFFSNIAAKNYYTDPKNSLRFYYLLNHMKIDKSNPFKKEWTVLVVKALCEGKYD